MIDKTLYYDLAPRTHYNRGWTQVLQKSKQNTCILIHDNNTMHFWNLIGDVMISKNALSVVVRGFDPWFAQNKDCLTCSIKK